MKTNMLLDTWCASGTDYLEFCKLANDIDESTKLIPIETNELTFLTIANTDNEHINFLAFDESSVNKGAPGHTRLALSAIYSSGGTDSLYDEMKRSALMLRHNGKVYFTTPELARDLGARADLSGVGLNPPTAARSAFLSSRYAAEPTAATLVVRENTADGKRIKKVFAVPSGDYRYIPHNTLVDLIENFNVTMHGAECKRWQVSNFHTQIWLDFENEANDIAATYALPRKMTPGVLIESSDTGDSSLRVTGTWRDAKGFIIRGDMYKREHKGGFSLEFVQKTVNNTIFSKYTELPERLCELLTVDVNDPPALLEEIFGEIRLDKVIGKRRQNQLLDALSMEFNSHAHYTAYDICMRLFEISTIFDEGERLQGEVEALVFKVAFLDYTKLIKKAAPLILSA